MGIQAILGSVPFLIDLAERLFPKRTDGLKRGPEKRAWVTRLIGLFFDRLTRTGKVPAWIVAERELILEAVDLLIEEIVSSKNAEEHKRELGRAPDRARELGNAVKPTDTLADDDA